MKVTRLASLTAAAALVLSACGTDDSDTEVTTSAPSPSSETETEDDGETTPAETEDPDEEGPEQSPGPTPTIDGPEDDEEHPHGDVMPGPDGVMPPQIIPFGEAAYRSTFVQGSERPFEWAPTLLDVQCGSTDPRDLNEEYSEELVDPLIIEVGREICSVTISYENIGTVPGVPDLPQGVIIDTVLHEQPSDPAIDAINQYNLESELREPLAPGVTLELETFLIAPADEEIDAIYFAHDASEVEVWLLAEED